MARRWRVLSVVLFCSIVLLTLMATQRNAAILSTPHGPSITVGHTIQQRTISEADADEPVIHPKQMTVSNDHVVQGPLKPNLSSTIPSKDISDVLSEMRQLIEAEMQNYPYPNRKYNVTATSLADLVPELGGRPLRNLVGTTWRSGSTFLGDILNSHPGTFYHYKPFREHSITRIRKDPEASKAVRRLKSLLSCNYTGLDKYLGYTKSHDQKYILKVVSKNLTDYNLLFSRNTRLWDQCVQHLTLCWSPDFLNPACRLFPFQTVKTVRLKLSLAERLLADGRLDVRVLLLVRDPRGTLKSRKHCQWCRSVSEVCVAKTLCEDLVADYASAKDFAVKYRDRFRVVRFEELSVKELLQFFGLDFHPNVQKFLDTHTKADAEGDYSTHRDSNSAAFNWRHSLLYRDVRAVQRHCKQAMDAWGYIQTLNFTHQREFVPITDYNLS